MTAAKISTEERKKLIADLWIIGIVSFLVPGIVVFAMQNGMNDFARQPLCTVDFRTYKTDTFN